MGIGPDRVASCAVVPLVVHLSTGGVMAFRRGSSRVSTAFPPARIAAGTRVRRGSAAHATPLPSTALSTAVDKSGTFLRLRVFLDGGPAGPVYCLVAPVGTGPPVPAPQENPS